MGCGASAEQKGGQAACPAASGEAPAPAPAPAGGSDAPPAAPAGGTGTDSKAPAAPKEADAPAPKPDPQADAAAKAKAEADAKAAAEAKAASDAAAAKAAADAAAKAEADAAAKAVADAAAKKTAAEADAKAAEEAHKAGYPIECANAPGMYLHVQNGAGDDAASAEIYNDVSAGMIPWKIDLVPGSNDTYTIQSAKVAGKFLHVQNGGTGDGNNVEIYHADGGTLASAHWRIRLVAGEEGVYNIENVQAAGKFLHVSSGSKDVGANAEIYSADGGSCTMAKWKVSPVALVSALKVAADKAAADAMALTDNATYVCPYFKVKNMEKFQEIWKAAYDPFANKADCVHYAFCFNGDRAHCREAYTDGSKVLQHLEDVDSPLKAVLDPEIASLERLEASGPAAEIEAMRDALAPLSCEFYTAEWGFRTPAPAQDPDTVIHLYPYFSIIKGREADFKKIWSYAYPATQAAASDEKNAMYAFCFSTNEDGVTTALCREAYADADGLLLHLTNVDAPLKAVLAPDISTLKRLEVHGPAAELDKLKDTLGPLGASFFETAWGFRNEVS